VIAASSSTMSVKGQLTASRDFLMAAIRASTRGATPNEHAGKVLQACLQLIEQLTRKADLLSADEVQTALDVLTRAAHELDDETPRTTAIVAALRNAIGRLQALRTEIATK
jgi:SUMO ligase MMS21 Smc5/6 complex component